MCYINTITIVWLFLLMSQHQKSGLWLTTHPGERRLHRFHRTVSHEFMVHDPFFIPFTFERHHSFTSSMRCKTMPIVKLLTWMALAEVLSNFKLAWFPSLEFVLTYAKALHPIKDVHRIRIRSFFIGSPSIFHFILFFFFCIPSIFFILFSFLCFYFILFLCFYFNLCVCFHSCVLSPFFILFPFVCFYFLLFLCFYSLDLWFHCVCISFSFDYVYFILFLCFH